MKEADIRPQNLFDEFLNLSLDDVEKYIDFDSMLDSACPGCASNQISASFNKEGFSYLTCSQCGSLYMSPRPTEAMMEEFYSRGKATAYFANVFIPAVLESRREKIFIPRVQRMKDLCDQHKFNPKSILEVGAGHGIFLEEWSKRFPETELFAIEPNEILAQICRDKGFDVLECIAEKASLWKEKADLVICFEVFEHIIDPETFIKCLYSFLKPGGMIVFTTLTVAGFDIQTLWDKSKSVNPPNHLNFCSPKGFKAVLNSVGFQNVNVETPGKLDVELVAKAYQENVIELSGFIKQIVTSDAAVQNAFQKFLQENGMSSHAWVSASKI